MFFQLSGQTSTKYPIRHSKFHSANTKVTIAKMISADTILINIYSLTQTSLKNNHDSKFIWSRPILLFINNQTKGQKVYGPDAPLFLLISQLIWITIYKNLTYPFTYNNHQMIALLSVIWSTGLLLFVQSPRLDTYLIVQAETKNTTLLCFTFS